MSQTDSTIPSQQQRMQRHEVPQQRMMQDLQGIDFEARVNSNKTMVYGHMQHNSMPSSNIHHLLGSGNGRSGHLTNLSRSLDNISSSKSNKTMVYGHMQHNSMPSSNIHHLLGSGNGGSGHLTNLSRSLDNISSNKSNQGWSTVNISDSTNKNGRALSRYSLSRVDPRFDANYDFCNSDMASSFTGGGWSKTNMYNARAYFKPTQPDSVFYTESSFSPQVNLSTKLSNSHLQNNDITVNQGKRRRLNYNQLATIMLDDFVPNYSITTNNQNQWEGNVNRNSNHDKKYLDHFTRKLDVLAPLTPLNQAKVKSFSETDAPLGQTPIMFAEFFLGNEEESERTIKVKEGIPLPPLYQSENDHRGIAEVQFDINASKDDDDDILTTPFSSEPLCLPPRRKKKSATPKLRKCTISSSPKSSQTKLNVLKRSSLNNDITPSSADILAPSTEILNQLQCSPGSVTDVDSSSPKPTDNTNDASHKYVSSITQFATSMEASQFSQQSIHDWDKKFGLRRAHSKTMRESTRSRKTVLEFLKRDGTMLLKSTAALVPKHSTSTSLMSKDEEDNDVDVQIKHCDTINQGPSEDKLQQCNDDNVYGAIQDESMDNDSIQLNTTSSSSTSSICDDDDKSMAMDSIGSFSHEEEKEHVSDENNTNDAHDNEFNSFYSSIIHEFDFEDEEFTKMFRRASLDHISVNTQRSSIHERSSTCNQISLSGIMPLPTETAAFCKECTKIFL